MFKIPKVFHYISGRQENANCDDFNFDEILWGIRNVLSLYLQ